MIVKNHKDIYKTTAELLGLDVELVSLVGNYTWEELGNMITNFTDREIYVLKLGSFRFRKAKAQRYMENVDKMMEKLKLRNMPEESKVEMFRLIRMKKEKMQFLIKEWDDIAEDRRRFKREVNESKGNIQEQEVDLGGDKEQDV